MHSFWSRLAIVVVGLSLLAVFNLRPATGSSTPRPASLQSNTLSLYAPLRCPQTGCAAGQTMTLAVRFPVSGYDPAQAPNLKVCVFMPNVWGVDSNTFSMDTTGQTTALPYTVDPTACQGASAIANYSLIAARQATLPSGWSEDWLRFSFRIPFSVRADQGAAVKVRIVTQTASQGEVVNELTSPFVPVAAFAETRYVAADDTVCGTAYKPCFLNSGPDDPGGIGTGLKDAVDAQPSGFNTSVVTVLGKYAIKGQTVIIDQPVKITSLDGANATITYDGVENDVNCGLPMLSLNDAVTLTNLFIDDGKCASKNRGLIAVNPAATQEMQINITSNTLSGGRDAIFIQDVRAQVNVLYNNIIGNSGFGLYWTGATNLGGLQLTANNMAALGSSGKIDCAGGTTAVQTNRLIDHNYWGNFSPESAATHCTSTLSRRLGAPILPRTGRPGVSAIRVTVTDQMPTRQPTATFTSGQATPTRIPFFSQLAYSRSGDGSQNFDMYIIDHGSSIDDSRPFASSSVRGVNPCSDYYDFFLPPEVTPTSLSNTTLDLYFYYDTVSYACESLVRFSDACAGRTPTPVEVPLLWYNPTANPTAWSSVMQPVGTETGQSVTCDSVQKQIHVAIDPTGRPNFNSDMGYLPVVLGSSIIQKFDTLAENQQVKISWTSMAEPDIDGYYILRGDSESSLEQLLGMFQAYKNASYGSTYNHTDTNLVNGQNYYYRLEIKRSDGQYIYSEVHSLAPNTPTIAPTLTATPVTPSPTPTNTLVPVNNPTRAFTRTITYGPGTPSPTAFMLPTLTGLYTRTPLFGLSGTPGLVASGSPQSSVEPISTQTPTATVTLPPDLETGTAIAMANNNTPTPTRRPTRTGTPAGALVGRAAGGSPTWLSLLLGLLAGVAVAVAAAVAWWYYRNRP